MTNHDSIEALLKATGRRPAVHADRTDRVRDAAHAGWRREVARRVRHRRIGWGMSLAAAAVVVVAVGLGIRALLPAIAPPLSGIRVERVANDAWARQRSFSLFRSKAPLHVGSILSWDDEVTTGADARVALRAPSGHSLRLDTDTTLRVLSDRVFALEIDEQPDSRAYFFLEADRGTMPVKRQSLSQTSFFRKLLAYEATWSQSLHRRASKRP